MGKKYKKDLDAALCIVQILINYSCSFKMEKLKLLICIPDSFLILHAQVCAYVCMYV